MDPEPTRHESRVDPPLEPTRTRAAIRDRRPIPQGGLPRHVQTWIMVGLALLILAVILMTGRPETGRSVSTAPAVTPPAPLEPARVRNYQERLAEQEARLRQDLVALETPPAAPAHPIPADPPDPIAVDPRIDERRRRDEDSLFADNVAFSRRPSAERPAAATPVTTASAPWPVTASGLPPMTPPPPSPASATADPIEQGSTIAAVAGEAGGRSGPPAPVGASEPVHALLEGTVIEAVLVNRLDGTFQGPVLCLVTTPVYTHDRHAIVIPAGARAVGSATPVNAWGDARLAVRFHRLVMPDGRAYPLDSFTGLNQVGETGLTDQVNRHYLQVFGASLAIGAVSGLAQVGTRGGFDPSFADASRQAAGASLATSTARILDRYLNVLPTVTIREGHRIKIVLTNDLRLPPYPRTHAAGVPPPAAFFETPRPVTAGGSR